MTARCDDCGFEVRTDDEEGLVAEVQRHAWEAHGMALSHDEALLLTFRLGLGGGHIPHDLSAGGTATGQDEI